MKKCREMMTTACLTGAAAMPALAASTLNAPIPPERPNVILIFTDDQGFADLGIQGTDPDVRTPHLDQLARDGVLFTRGYVTAPQCIPSRAAVVSGRHQNAFGLDDNLGGPLSFDEFTVPERLREAGYVTGMIGKWHLELGFDENLRAYFSPDHLPHRHGFDEVYMGYMQRYRANYDLDGNDLPGEELHLIEDPHFRVDIQTRAALAFLERRKADDRPFYLYLCWFAPHSPIESPPQYTERLAHVEAPIRRAALASILAMDDGLGLIRAKLEEMGLTENTLIFYISDNGAPLVEGNYIGSLNTPLTGEKGMLIDGGQRVPFIAAWPGRIPGGQLFDEMVWSLDAVATAVALAGAPVDERIEGVNLIPWLTGERSGPLHDALAWRWRTQASILTDDWMFVRLGNERRYLFPTQELGTQRAEHNRIDEFPEVAQRLEEQLRAIADTWKTPGLPEEAIAPDRRFFDMHVDGTAPFPPMEDGRSCGYIPWDDRRPQTQPDAPFDLWAAARESVQVFAGTGAPNAHPARMQGWEVRQGIAESHRYGVFVYSHQPDEITFIEKGFEKRLRAPVVVEIEARAPQATTLQLAWGDDSVEPGVGVKIDGGFQWTQASATLTADESISTLRIQLEGLGETPVEFRRIRLVDADGTEQVYGFER